MVKYRPRFATTLRPQPHTSMKKKPLPAPPETPSASPFAVLAGLDVPKAAPDESQTAPADPRAPRRRLDVRRMTAHRGGKTVTVITGFDGVPAADVEQLAKRLQKACGAGGTLKQGRVEIQGDQRKSVVRLLEEAGFRPVLAGG